MSAAPWTTETLRASDGAPLTVYSAGDPDRPTVLLCNAVGMPVEFLRPLSKQLLATHSVLTWESRLLPSPVGPFGATLERQVADAMDVLAHFRVSRAIVAGWCLGANLALWLTVRWPGSIPALVLMNGGYYLDSADYTPFEANMVRMMPRIAGDLRYAAAFHRTIFSTGAAWVDANETQAGVGTSATPQAQAAAEQIKQLASLPYESAEALHQFARLTTAHMESPPDMARLPRTPTLVMTSANDSTTGTPSSHRIAAALPDATLISSQSGDHFSLYWEHAYRSQVQRFVQKFR
ncbi:alpha/beta fold hydrolase [Nocardia iowensis]|uniref:Alpha/beta hydrolase n=1 Tax=Nocardia iowensis TaxID=204891 RepID=A0ABX8RG69_NOCIO|nr:alpha/beta fold hydrolase [Nocardia iowensis]QXN88613.1 alpha/beta hydrolase [Nocardia iowensis]